MTNIENKKSEALSRMITLGLHTKVMQKFQNGVLTCSELTEDGSFLHREPTAEESVSIGAFQKEHNCLVYYAIKTHTNIGTMFALLYISDNVEEWASDMLDIQAKTPMAYVINYDAEWCSEFGSIGVANVCGQLVRTK